MGLESISSSPFKSTKETDQHELLKDHFHTYSSVACIPSKMLLNFLCLFSSSFTRHYSIQSYTAVSCSLKRCVSKCISYMLRNDQPNLLFQFLKHLQPANGRTIGNAVNIILATEVNIVELQQAKELFLKS